MLDRKLVEDLLRKMVASRMPSKPDPASIAANVPIFQKGLGLDSMSGIEFVTEIEERFNIYIGDDDFDIFDSLQNLIEFVLERSPG
jgi:acyl carrier protein